MVTGEVIYTIAASVIIMLGLTWFTTRTRTGKAMRAVSEDRDAAQLMGINVNQTISMTFAIGSALAAVAGVLLCSTVPTLQPTTGSMPGIRAFTAAVSGGIGSIPGLCWAVFCWASSRPSAKPISAPVQRRDRVCRPDCDPAGEARRSAGQAGSGEGMRWML